MGGEYSEIHGNPYLKPEINYQLQLTYILKSKYIFNVWYSHTKDNATQTLFISPPTDWSRSISTSILILSNKQVYKLLFHLR